MAQDPTTAVPYSSQLQYNRGVVFFFLAVLGGMVVWVGGSVLLVFYSGFCRGEVEGVSKPTHSQFACMEN